MTFRAWAVGEVLTAANQLKYASKASGKPLVSCTKSGSQSIATATATAVTWDTEAFDTDGIHDTVTNNSRFTVVTAGYYSVYAQVEWGGSATGVRDIFVRVNGVATDYLRKHEGTAPASNQTEQTSGIIPVRLGVGDYFEFYVNQTSGGALSIATTTGQHWGQCAYESD